MSSGGALFPDNTVSIGTVPSLAQFFLKEMARPERIYYNSITTMWFHCIMIIIVNFEPVLWILVKYMLQLDKFFDIAMQ